MAEPATQPLPRRRRKAREDARDVEEAILAATERLLADKPLGELTVADIIAAAGTSRASFYFYFESKYAALATLAEHIVDEVYDASRAWLERSDQAPEAALREALTASAALWRRHEAVLRATVEGWRSVPELRDLWQGLMSRFTRAAAAQIERDRSAGVAPPGADAAALASSLVWMNERCLYIASVDADPALGSDDQLVDALTAVWVRAVYGR